MILDTSAIIAILRNETEATVFAKAVEEAVHRRISAVNYVESGCCHRWQPGPDRGPPIR